jgi:C4-dicarboxylate-specific signal transduction histidine kinase
MSGQPNSSSDHLRFSSAVLRLLGEELNPSPNQGIVELVKNAYDADATWCRVELEGEHIPRGTLRVRDNGEGMTPDDIRSGWLIVGESRKQNTGYSKRNKRLYVGSKGLGRLAALRLGRRASLITRPREKPEVEYLLSINWEAYDGSIAVDTVPLVIETRERELGASHGTEIEISGLHAPWTAAAIRKLARTLHLLSDPFADKAEKCDKLDFAVSLTSEAFKEIVLEASADYWTHCDYHLVSGVDETGKGWARVFDATKRVVFEANHATIAGKEDALYLVPAFDFELWEFKLDSKKFATTTINASELKKWLGEFGGVHLYYRGVRVSPYGDSGNDWLDLNLARARSPEERPSTNNSIGRVRLKDPEGLFVQKTDRQGFVENTSIEQMREFAADVVGWMQSCRLKKRDERKRSEKKLVVEAKSRTEQVLQNEISKLPEAERRPVQAAVESHLKAVGDAMTVLEKENQLYHTLGTIGTTASAFAHQSEKPLSIIERDANTLEYLLGDPSTPSFPSLSIASLDSIRKAAQALLAFTAVTLKMLEHEKRNRGRQPLQSLIVEITELLKPYLESRDASVQLDFQMTNPLVFGSRAAIESIFTNLIVNSLRAFARDYYKGAEEPEFANDRRILIRTQKVGDRVLINYADSGPGIQGISVDDIWVVGETTTPKGSGLGLCIVRDTVEDMGGVISAEPTGELGGAEFSIELPLRG